MNKIDPDKYKQKTERAKIKKSAIGSNIQKQIGKALKQARQKAAGSAKGLKRNKAKQQKAVLSPPSRRERRPAFGQTARPRQRPPKDEQKLRKNVKTLKIVLFTAFLLYVIYLLASRYIEEQNKPDIFIYPFDTQQNGIEVTDWFGTRVNPITGEEGDFHHGIDFALDWHCQIYAASDGVVTFAGNNESLGNYVMIKHRHLYTLYGHLSAIIVKEGDRVHSGQTIGIEGGDPAKDPNPGTSTGDHLHFAILDLEKNYLDPAPYLNLSK